jgi:integrase
MTAVRQRGSVYAVRGGYGIRWREDGARRFESGFETKTAAREWFVDNVLPRLRGELPEPAEHGEITLEAFVDVFLDAHAANVSPRTVETLRVRLRPATRKFGSLTLVELEPRAAEIAAWRSTLPPRARYGYTSALRQVLDAAVGWGRMTRNPAKLAGPNPQPRREEVVPFTGEEVEAIAAELGETYGPLVVFAAETGLRTQEWIALERRDVDRDGGAVVVERAFSDGTVRPILKTDRSRRRVPLSARARAALEELPRRIDTPLLFPTPAGGPIDLHNWRAREWESALRAAGFYTCPDCEEAMKPRKGTRAVRWCEPCGTETPTRPPYDLRHTFASNALAAGLSTFELSRVMGTSVGMIDRVYGHLVKGSDEAIRERLDGYSREIRRSAQPDTTAAKPDASPTTRRTTTPGAIRPGNAASAAMSRPR